MEKIFEIFLLKRVSKKERHLAIVVARCLFVILKDWYIDIGK